MVTLRCFLWMLSITTLELTYAFTTKQQPYATTRPSSNRIHTDGVISVTTPNSRSSWSSTTAADYRYCLWKQILHGNPNQRSDDNFMPLQAESTSVSLLPSVVNGDNALEIHDNSTSTNGETVAIPASSLDHGTSNSPTSRQTSKRAMLTFAIPALGIYLCNPLLSNIDNAFVGQTIGTIGLAALSPATICIDQMLYLFNFLGRATTGIVTRAYATADSAIINDTNSTGTSSNTIAARDAASARTLIELTIVACICLVSACTQT
jgi:hypothetical protein